MLVDLLNLSLPFFYLLAVVVYGRAFYASVETLGRSKRGIIHAVLLVHAAYLIARTIAFDHPPATNIFEILTLLAFATSLSYAVIETRTGRHETGFFVLIPAFLFQSVSSLYIRDLLEVPEILRSSYFGVHVASALAGYAGITLSAVYGSLYLMLYHQIKSVRFGAVYRKLPSLENLERMSILAASSGFIFLAVAMLAGLLWLPKAFTEVSYADPKLVGTVLVWLMYGAALAAQRTGRWKGRRLMVVAIVGFAISLFSMTVVNMFFTGFHRFA